MKKTDYLNFGAGTPDPYWTNIDATPYFLIPRFFYWFRSLFGHKHSRAFVKSHYKHFHYRKGKRLPFPDDSFSYIYCSHVLEHLHVEDIAALMTEFERVLRKGGVLRIVFPDMMQSLKDAFANEALVDFSKICGSLPYGGRRKRFRSAFEALNRFPGTHKTIMNYTKFKQKYSGVWKISGQKKWHQSIIPKKYLENIESERHSINALIFDMVLSGRATAKKGRTAAR